MQWSHGEPATASGTPIALVRHPPPAIVRHPAGSQAVHAAVAEFQAVRDDIDSVLLRRLTGTGGSSGEAEGLPPRRMGPSFSWRGVAEALGDLSRAADWPEAERSGRVVPSRVSMGWWSVRADPSMVPSNEDDARSMREMMAGLGDSGC